MVLLPVAWLPAPEGEQASCSRLSDCSRSAAGLPGRRCARSGQPHRSRNPGAAQCPAGAAPAGRRRNRRLGLHQPTRRQAAGCAGPAGSAGSRLSAWQWSPRRPAVGHRPNWAGGRRLNHGRVYGQQTEALQAWIPWVSGAPSAVKAHGVRSKVTASRLLHGGLTQCTHGPQSRIAVMVALFLHGLYRLTKVPQLSAQKPLRQQLPPQPQVELHPVVDSTGQAMCSLSARQLPHAPPPEPAQSAPHADDMLPQQNQVVEWLYVFSVQSAPGAPVTGGGSNPESAVGPMINVATRVPADGSP